MEDGIVNCKVFDIADGSKHLVFTIAGTGACVGELRLAAQPQYYKVIGQLFSNWTLVERGLLPSAIRNVLNGKHARNHP